MAKEEVNLSSEARRLLQRTGERTGITDPQRQLQMVKAVTRALADQLHPLDRAWLVRFLPAGLYEEGPAAAAAAGTPGLLALTARVATACDVTMAMAMEYAQCVCGALAELLESEQVANLVGRVPDDCIQLFSADGSDRAPVRDRGRRRGFRSKSLAQGKSGSDHGLATAAPPGAQQESVLRSTNPHGDTKLSSSTGTTQEREADTIARNRSRARGRP